MFRRKGIKRERAEVMPATAPEMAVAGVPLDREIVEYRQAICPVCGASHGRRNGQNFWERTKDFDPNKPFGVIQDIGRVGKSGIRTVGYFQPDDDPDGYFPLVKARLIAAVFEWINKDWIAPAEIKAILPD